MNKNRMYKWSAASLCLLLAGACTSTGSESGGGSGQGDAGSAKAQKVTILMDRATNFPDDNPVIQEIRKRSGVDVQVESVVTADYENRLNTLIVSRKAPDIFKVPKAKLKELVDNKVIMPLDDLLKSHGQHMLDNKGKFLKGPAYIDGKTYGLPDGWFSGNALAIRKDWLDKLGLQVPTTLEEYEKVLRAFVNNDPDGNGLKDTIGLGVAIEVSQTWEHIFAAYGVPLNRQVTVDGKVIPWMLAPGYLDAVKFLNSLYKQGLIDPEFATVPTLQSFEKLWNGKVGAYNFNADGTTQNWLSRYVENPKPQFVYAVIKGPNGVGGHLKPVLEDSSSFTVISSSAQNPEAAMKALDYLVSEDGSKLTWAGLEGMHHKWTADKKFEWIPPYDDAVKLRDAGGYMYSVIMYRIGGLRDQLFNDITRKARQMVLDHAIKDTYIFDLPAIQKERGTILSDMEKEFRTLAITSNGNIDALYNDFKTKYLAEGGSKWIEQATAIYKAEQEALRK
ncbi:putative aldouronate transport system substrate-binding protein [Paenibacillus sp. UNCCL117]|uniref:extracellular solute-binding protein n=1 Tax=unclassified Paenibacillus TaxID=185978 RepID=UPI0008837AAA|nr:MULTISPECIES: extracellular solute-binding protein [unclassified Paenibacillus]SDD57429.1 putative aldouronate transport system substrate-binding protein [Paenibacillus sp. cl123]SFW51186.1 putative aldouronate transport system substrate-binding protein [Paenibacillus sp. UNCCL117]